MTRSIPVQAPDGCKTLEQHERQLTALADELETRGIGMIRREGRIDVATGKELVLAAIRSRKLAAELAADRESRTHERWLAAEAARIRNADHAAGRPRLVVTR